MGRRFLTIDGNEAAARIAHMTNEVIAIYPITPSSGMGELSDAWSARGQKNLWGTVPQVVEMQSEGGVAGAVHGALQAGSLTTTFTASQGLLLMIPNMFKIAGELTPVVFHVAARAIATHALSIFGDHSDVMAARTTGWAMLCASDIQEAQDFALISQAASLRSRLPFLHFFDGFRTSHELNKIVALEEEQIRALIPEAQVRAHRERALSPDHPVLRGTAQNPDVFFQAREAVNPYYDALPAVLEDVFEQFERIAGRRYAPFAYEGDADAERVVVLMGSGVGASQEAVARLRAEGEKVGVLKVRLFRPFSAERLLAALPPSVKGIAVLDRTKEPGAEGEPLFLDVASAVLRLWHATKGTPPPHCIGGRYGLGSKEFTPAMVKAALDELRRDAPSHGFTVGIADDVTHRSLPYDAAWSTEPADVTRCVFYGLGSDGTVGANKNSAKIIGQNTDLHAQGYFVYDSKKSGSVTVSHLRFGPKPIRSTYLIREAQFVACHQYNFLEKMDVLDVAARGATLLLNSPHPADEVFGQLSGAVQQQILDKQLSLHVIDAARVAREVGMGSRINTIMQACFFALSGILPRDEALAAIKSAIQKSYGSRGQTIVERNWAAVDAAVDNLHAVALPPRASATSRVLGTVDLSGASEFVQKVTAVMMAGKGDLLPVSAMPVDGTFPTGTTRFEKRSIAAEIPIWDGDVCIQCGLCAFVCPHAAIRMKAFAPSALEGAPDGFDTATWSGREYADTLMTIRVAPDDCTGCGVCVDICPAHSKENRAHKAINMEPQQAHLERERANYEYFLEIPEMPREQVQMDLPKGSQLLQPLFEYSGACAGCGETPYIKLMTQLFGDRVLVANATGCSSIYGGNLPTTPYAKNAEGRGPAWSNSLFEDNAEFGLGMRLALDSQVEHARRGVAAFREVLGDQLVDAILSADQVSEREIDEQRERIQEAKRRLSAFDSEDAQSLLRTIDALARKSVWIVGGDGWAYDIGFGGLDHVLSSGRNVNILVLDTEVYSNTGGQASKATPRGAVAKFAAGGKPGGKKDLGMIAMACGNVYVGQIALGANPKQAIRTFREAEDWEGPSLIIAYSQCIAHGIDMSTGMTHQRDAVGSGYWPLYRFDPRHSDTDHLPFQLDSRKPRIPFTEFANKEARFAMLARIDPETHARLVRLAQQDINERWHLYEQMAGVERTVPGQESAESADGDTPTDAKGDT